MEQFGLNNEQTANQNVVLLTLKLERSAVHYSWEKLVQSKCAEVEVKLSRNICEMKSNFK